MNDISTRDRILCEAEKKFVSDGISNTQMKDIAKDLNINRRTLYRYFPSKDELAFEVELIVMKKIQEYLNFSIDEDSLKTGFDKIKYYFEKVDFESMKELIKFTAEFDRYFQNSYPSKNLEDNFLEILNPENDPLYQYFVEGINDGSIRNDLSAEELFSFTSHSFFALFQRIILRENHLNDEYCSNIDFNKIYKEIVLSGLKNR